jgi:hypothetical protein
MWSCQHGRELGGCGRDAEKLCKACLLFVNVLPSCFAGVSPGFVGETVGFGVTEPVFTNSKLGSHGLSHVGFDFDWCEVNVFSI